MTEHELRFTLGTALGGNEQHTVGTFGTVNGRRSGIFQYFDVFDIVGVQSQHVGKVFGTGRGKVEIIVDIGVVRHTVDDDKRIGIGVQRGRTTNTDRTFGTGVTASKNIHTGQLTLQGFFYRVHRQRFHHFVHRNSLARTGKGAFRHAQFRTMRTFLSNHHFAKCLGIFLHHHILGFLSGVRNTLRHQTDERIKQGEIFAGRHTDGILSVDIGGNTGHQTVLRIHHCHVHTHTRFLSAVEYFVNRTRQHASLRISCDSH